MAKHLPAFGWRPIVVRADERFYAEPPDLALNALVPPSVEQVRTRALATRLCRRLGIGDIGLRGYFGFQRALDDLIVRERPAAVFITGAPYYPLLLARRVKRHGVPVVLDFQDPWVSAFGAAQPAFSKAGISHRLGVFLERRAVAAADAITSVSEIQNREMAERYAFLDPAAMFAVPIGGDPEDFATVRGKGPEPSADGRIELRYIGAYWPRAEPAVRAVLRGLAALRAMRPELAARLALHFVGTWTGGGDAPRLVEALAREEGVAEMVRETPERAPFVEALRLMSTATGLVLVGSDEPHYTASKIYPTLMSGRPYLSLFHERSSAHEILTRAGGGEALGFGESRDLAALIPNIAEGLIRLATTPESFGAADPHAYAPFTARAVAGRYAAIFDGLAAR